MTVKLRQIEVDEETALLLEARAGARGLTVSQLPADLACTYEVMPPDLAEMRSAYVVRYRYSVEKREVVVLRAWHGRERRI